MWAVDSQVDLRDIKAKVPVSHLPMSGGWLHVLPGIKFAIYKGLHGLSGSRKLQPVSDSEVRGVGQKSC